MYTITGDQVSFRLNAQEKEEINQLAISMQTDENEVFSNSKNIVFALITRLKASESELKALEIKLKAVENDLETAESALIQLGNDVEELESNKISSENNLLDTEIELRFHAAKIQLGHSEEENIPNIEILDQLISISKNPVIREVEKIIEPTENELLLNLHPSQVKVIDEISLRRFQAGDDEIQNTREKQVLELIFNQQTLFNWAGNYSTHIKLVELKK